MKLGQGALYFMFSCKTWEVGNSNEGKQQHSEGSAVP